MEEIMRRIMKKNLLISWIFILLVTAITGCSGGENSSSENHVKESNSKGNDSEESNAKEKGTNGTADLESMTYEEMKEAAGGTTVSFYGWGGDEQLNQWLDNEFALLMKEKYNITMERIPMDIDQILSQLSGEIQAGQEAGSIDMIWINGENFQSAKENNMLYGPFVDKLPNYSRYLDTTSEDVTLDFAYPVEGFEAPYGKAQIVMIADTAIVNDLPTSTEKLMKFVQEHPGKVTYPALPDFTGSAFVRNVIYDICGYEQFLDMEADKQVVKEAIEPALEYLRALNPYLWNKGAAFPDSSMTLDNMFADGEVLLNMTYDAYGTAIKIENGAYTETTQTFQFDKGTIGNTNFIAISVNAPNKIGAMAAINEMLSPEVQADRYEKLKILPVVDYEKLDNTQKAAFNSVDLGKGTIPQDKLLEKRLPEMKAELVPIIEEIWEEEVVGK
jgi:putative spermidine/putrescine transport system substrate-binding protein